MATTQDDDIGDGIHLATNIFTFLSLYHSGKLLVSYFSAL